MKKKFDIVHLIFVLDLNLVWYELTNCTCAMVELRFFICKNRIINTSIRTSTELPVI